MNAIWWDKGDCRGHLADKIHDKLCKIERNSEKNLFEEKNYWKKKLLKKKWKKKFKKIGKKSSKRIFKEIKTPFWVGYTESVE